MRTPHDHTSLGGVTRAFPATEWTRLLHCPQRRAVIAELCEKYWKPVYCYLRNMGFANEQAKDLTQGFFTDKVLGQDLIQKADRDRGRFRNFMLRAVHNYAISLQRESRSHCLPTVGSGEDNRTHKPDREFIRAWANQVLTDVLVELEAECRQRGKLTHWLIFRDWLLATSGDLRGRRMVEVAAVHGIHDPSKAYHMIENLKRRFRAILRTRLGQFVQSEEEIEAEIREFMGVFL